LKRYKPRSSESTDFFSLQDCVAALDRLSGNDLLSKMVSGENGPGYNVWKDATSPVGVSIDELAAFATAELRMTSLEKFVSDTFPTYVLRERQDTKARYEVKGSGLRISKIFASIEENKEELRLADYSVSQTSLEQVREPLPRAFVGWPAKTGTLTLAVLDARLHRYSICTQQKLRGISKVVWSA